MRCPFGTAATAGAVHEQEERERLHQKEGNADPDRGVVLLEQSVWLVDKRAPGREGTDRYPPACKLGVIELVDGREAVFNTDGGWGRATKDAVCLVGRGASLIVAIVECAANDAMPKRVLVHPIHGYWAVADHVLCALTHRELPTRCIPREGRQQHQRIARQALQL